MAIGLAVARGILASTFVLGSVPFLPSNQPSKFERDDPIFVAAFRFMVRAVREKEQPPGIICLAVNPTTPVNLTEGQPEAYPAPPPKAVLETIRQDDPAVFGIGECVRRAAAKETAAYRIGPSARRDAIPPLLVVGPIRMATAVRGEAGASLPGRRGVIQFDLVDDSWAVRWSEPADEGLRSLIAHLRSGGFTVAQIPRPSSPGALTGELYRFSVRFEELVRLLDEQWRDPFDAYVYPSAEDALKDAARISSDGWLIDGRRAWHSPPVFFRHGNVIAACARRERFVLWALEGTFGAPFAGGVRHGDPASAIVQ